MPRMLIPEKLEPLLFRPKRFKVAYGGRGGAKSQSFADIFLYLAQTQRHKIGCFREMQNSIEDSVHSLLKDEIGRLGLRGFGVEKNTIWHKDGGEFRFKGLSRNPDAVKSMNGFTRFWVEEAQSISDESLKVLTPTLRTSESEIWFSLNPMSSEDPMSKRFLKPFESDLLRNGYYEDDLHMIVRINYEDNPWFPAELEQERQWDYEHLSRAEYNHIWLGHYLDTVENAIILPEWFDAAIDAHVKLGFKSRGAVVVAHDPADSGDPRGLVVRHGSVVLEALERQGVDVNEACDWALECAIDRGADLFTWDCDGLGVSLRRQVSESLAGKRIDWQMFKGSEAPDDPHEPYQGAGQHEGRERQRQNKDTFRNKRAQYYWALRDRFFRTYRAVAHGEYADPDQLISLSSSITEMAKLRAEVCRIPKRPSGNGFIQIMTKQEMRTRYKLPSPNLADALMMSQRYRPRVVDAVDEWAFEAADSVAGY